MSDRVSKPRTLAGRRALAAALVLAGVFAAAAPSRADDVFLSVEHRLASLQRSIAPELYRSTLLFAYRPERPTRYVALRLKNDVTLHVYEREIKNSPEGKSESKGEPWSLLLLTLDLSKMDIPTDGKLLYRMTVDGVWMTDPANPRRELDPETRLQWSVVEVDPHAVKPPRSPEVTEQARTRNGSVKARFLYLGREGSRVALMGDFNGWDPYMHTLTETTAGHYTIEVWLPPGEHEYALSVDGVWTTDPLNPHRELGRTGREVCVWSPGR